MPHKFYTFDPQIYPRLIWVSIGRLDSQVHRRSKGESEMQLTITLEQALEKASPRLREKMQHSVKLARKSERLALKYDMERGFAVGFSGGKDSQAAYHIMQLAGVKFWAQFSPTSVDPPEVVRFIKREYPEVEFRKLETNIFKRAVEIGCLPTMRIRWCCAEFKENAFPNKVTVVGVRKAESAKRAKRNEIEVTSHKFSGDLDEFDLWSEKQRKRIGKKVQNLNQDQFSEPQGESTVRCVGGKDSIIVMPILYWTDEDVWEFLNNVVEVPHCSLYDEGRKRIGCIMCPFASAKSIYADIKRWPHVYWKWVDVVRQLREERPSTGGGIWSLVQNLSNRTTRRPTLPPPPEYQQEPTANPPRSLLHAATNTTEWELQDGESNSRYGKSKTAYLHKMGRGVSRIPFYQALRVRAI